ncbi:hypothetical protein F5X99DRAFT_405435 [Biscogniauxia marginata]|nr:hypothetical protein F5X99DRAFT_405435 [Biscogniauxia marginata]
MDGQQVNQPQPGTGTAGQSPNGTEPIPKKRTPLPTIRSRRTALPTARPGRTPTPASRRSLTRVSFAVARLPQLSPLQPSGPGFPATAQGIPCPTCHLVLKNPQSWRQHVKTKHIGTVCHWPGCNRTFSTEVLLYEHLKWHNEVAAVNKDETRCNWPGCGALLSMEQQVRRHLRGHTVTAHKAAAENTEDAADATNTEAPSEGT